MSKASKAARRISLALADEIQKVYDLIPQVRCKGLCQGSCTSIMMSEAEIVNIGNNAPALAHHPWKSIAMRAVSGLEKPKPCPALDKTGRCGIYAVRPAICRMYGAYVDLTCPHGCEIVTGTGLPLSKLQGNEIIRRLQRIDPYPDPLT